MQDIRKALDDKNLDAVSIATPNHWHSLMAIWACQAGKDVYVEKPCSHNVFEGRKLVEAARKYDRIVQHGTQRRADPQWIQVATTSAAASTASCWSPTATPASRGGASASRTRRSRPRDWTSTSGSARRPSSRSARNLVHYNWHWFWDFGNGEIGNKGAHQMDIGRWAMPDGARAEERRQPRRPLRLQGPGPDAQHPVDA